MHDGAKVAFVGHPSDGVEIGDEGLVLQAGNTGSHVKWKTGAAKNTITLVGNDDLVINGSLAKHPLTDGLEGDVVGISVRATFDRRGAVGVLNALNEEGHLSAFGQIAEDAMQMVASRIRQDPSFVEVLAVLDPDEGASLVEVAAASLLRDAFGEV
jgi:hypothetical protein